MAISERVGGIIAIISASSTENRQSVPLHHVEAVVLSIYVIALALMALAFHSGYPDVWLVSQVVLRAGQPVPQA